MNKIDWQELADQSGVKLWIGAIVFLRVASERKPGLITGVVIRGNGSLTYEVTFEDVCSCHYAMELSEEWAPDWQN
jgi:hypothetical protein